MQSLKNLGTALACASLLVACGGANDSAPSSPPITLAHQLAPAQKTQAVVTASSYQDVVQSLYLSYFGRPADPQGLANVEAVLLAAGAPTDAAGVTLAYGLNPDVKNLIDSFATSPESLALYNHTNSVVFVSSVFSNLFNRQPATEGSIYWSVAIQYGGLSQSAAALSILAGAIPNSSTLGMQDGQTVANRIAWANAFTAQVASQGATTSYTGSRSASIARNALAAVTAFSDSTSFAADANLAITAIVNAKLTSSPALNAISWSGTQYVAVGQGGIVESSPDGIIWANRGSALSAAYSLANLSAVSWQNGKFLAIGTNGGHEVCARLVACPPLDAAQADVIVSSPDGVTWTSAAGAGLPFTPSSGSELNGLTWSGTQFVAVGDTLSEGADGFSDMGNVYTSTDGMTWTPQTTVQGANTAAQVFDQLTGVASSPSSYVAVSADGYIYTSPSGSKWTQQVSPLNTFKAVMWSGSQFVAVGQGNVVMTSVDGSNWAAHPVNIPTLNAVAWSGTQFVAVGNGVILTSPDAVTWTAQNAGTFQSLYAVNWAESQFVAVGDGVIVTSPDGINWTSRLAP